jgi:hypothetical protein
MSHHVCLWAATWRSPAGTGGYTLGARSSSVACSYVCTATAGRYCPPGATTPSSIVCPLGTFSLASADACTLCSAGKFGAQNGSASGLRTSACSGLCPPGRFSGPGSPTCTACPAGTFSTTAGGTSALSCSGVCTSAPGSFCGRAAATSNGAPCPPGRFSSASNASTCTPCGVGTMAPSPGVAACIACPPGRYTAVEAATACSACPALTYAHTSGASSASCVGPCLAVPGRYCGAGSVAPSGFVCPRGRYSAGGPSVADCSNCPPGRCELLAG